MPHAKKKKQPSIQEASNMTVITVTEQMIEEAIYSPRGRHQRIEVDLSGEGSSSAAKSLTRALKKFRYAGMDGDGTQRFEIENAGVLPFGLVGRLMHEARRGTKGRIPESELQRISAKLDGYGLKPKDCLEGNKDRTVLGEYNRKNSRAPYDTFSKALKCHEVLSYLETMPNGAGSPTLERRKLSCTLRRAVLKWFYSALRSWKKTHPES